MNILVFSALTPVAPDSAVAHPDIALFRYWRNSDPGVRIPASGSISMDLGGLETRASVIFDPILGAGRLVLNGVQVNGEALGRVVAFTDRVPPLSGLHQYAPIHGHSTSRWVHLSRGLLAGLRREGSGSPMENGSLAKVVREIKRQGAYTSVSWRRRKFEL